jgi:hypothetical protein
MRLVVQVAAEGEGGDAVACPGEHALMAVASCSGGGSRGSARPCKRRGACWHEAPATRPGAGPRRAEGGALPVWSPGASAAGSNRRKKKEGERKEGKRKEKKGEKEKKKIKRKIKYEKKRKRNRKKV